MDHTKFNALIRLLDDTDPTVETHVKDTLISLGESAIPQLEEAWEQQSDEWVQGRIEDIIQTIQTGRTVQALRDWKSIGGGSLLRGWYLTTQFQFPELDYVAYKNEINRLVNRIWLEFRSGMNLPEKLLVVNRMLFVREKYRLNKRSLYEPKNYFLNTLIDTKKGSPISLGMLYLIICEELDLPLRGILLPGYFVLIYQDPKNEFFVDVPNKGAFFMRKDLADFIRKMSLSEEEERYYQPSSSLDILREWAHTLSNSYRQIKQPERAERLDILLDELGEEE